MTDQEINVAIAEACGWERVGVYEGFLMGVEPLDGQFVTLPDYCNNLNAMHEAEMTLPNEYVKRLYIDHLVCLMEAGTFTVMASARQRAEAFLRVIGKWMT